MFTELYIKMNVINTLSVVFVVVVSIIRSHCVVKSTARVPGWTPTGVTHSVKKKKKKVHRTRWSLWGMLGKGKTSTEQQIYSCCGRRGTGEAGETQRRRWLAFTSERLHNGGALFWRDAWHYWRTFLSHHTRDLTASLFHLTFKGFKESFEEVHHPAQRHLDFIWRSHWLFCDVFRVNNWRVGSWKCDLVCFKESKMN